MQVIDAVLLAMLAFGTVSGLTKGLVRQVVELVGVVASFFIAMLLAGWAAEQLAGRTGLDYQGALVVGFLVLLGAGVVVFHFVALAIRRIIRMTFLGWVDRFAGGALGLVLAIVVTSSLVALARELPLPRGALRALERSRVAMFVEPVAPWIFDTVLDHGHRGVAFRDIVRGRRSL